MKVQIHVVIAIMFISLNIGSIRQKIVCLIDLHLSRDDTSSIERHKTLGGIPLYDWPTVRVPNTAFVQLADYNVSIEGQYTIRRATENDVPSILYMNQVAKIGNII